MTRARARGAGEGDGQHSPTTAVELLAFPFAVCAETFHHLGQLRAQLQRVIADGSRALPGPARSRMLALREPLRDACDRLPAFSAPVMLSGLGSRDGGSVCLAVPEALVVTIVSLGALLDELDSYCGTPDLPVAPPALRVRRFRRWVISEISHQSRGEPPVAWNSGDS